VGSADYVGGSVEAERDRIALYMNYDMVGSPELHLQASTTPTSRRSAPEGVPIPAGSTAIEDLYESTNTAIGEPYDDTEFSGRSDYEAFILAGIPSSGLFTGAEEVKTAEQAAIWGGVAGEWFDPCYHQACDTIANVNLHALDVNSDAIAFAMLTFAYSTESVNGVSWQEDPGSGLLPAGTSRSRRHVRRRGGRRPLPPSDGIAPSSGRRGLPLGQPPSGCPGSSGERQASSVSGSS
jgi:Zn-dependent M28 family amino/carboxypeptidase